MVDQSQGIKDRPMWVAHRDVAIAISSFSLGVCLPGPSHSKARAILMTLVRKNCDTLTTPCGRFQVSDFWGFLVAVQGLEPRTRGL